MTAPTVDLTGSWFPSGYFGHSRSQRRNDFINEYRQMAKPHPPNTFQNRLQVYRASQGNPFSEHDMRQSREYLDLIFEHYPKSRSESAHVKKRACTYDFTRWDRVPGDDYYRPSVTSYNNAFRWYQHQRPPQPPIAEPPVQPMRISRRPISAYEYGTDTTYRYDFCGGSPPAGTLNAMGNRDLLSVKQMQLQPRQTAPLVPAPPAGEAPRQRARSAKPDESVARCLVWPEPPGGPNRLLQRPFSAHPNLISSASHLPETAAPVAHEPPAAAAAPPPPPPAGNPE